MEAVTRYLWVALGGAIGSVGRFWLAAAIATLTGPRFPWGTLLINVVGSFVIGWFAALTSDAGPLDVPQGIRLLVLVGLCGGFTTFSSFSLQTMELLQAGELVRAGGYIVGSVVLCLIFVWFGATLGRA
jgi:CrcB protein